MERKISHPSTIIIEQQSVRAGESVDVGGDTTYLPTYLESEVGCGRVA